MATPTRERFQQMDFLSQVRLKRNLLGVIFIRVCDAISTQKLQDLARFLGKRNSQELMKHDDRRSEDRVIMDLLFKVQRSLKKDPTWWEILERILREEDMDLYYHMNHWEREEDMPGRAAGGGAKEETSTRTSETSQTHNALETDTPSSQQVLEDVPQRLQSSQLEMQEEVNAASQNDMNSIQPPCPCSPAHLPKRINNININKVTTLILIQKHNIVSKHPRTNESGEEGESGGDEEPVFHLPIPVTVQETYEGENYDGSSEGCTSQSCDPPPMDIDAHQTILKRPHMHHEVCEEHDVSEEPLEEDFDDVDLRENHRTVTGHASSEEDGDRGQEDVQKVWTQDTDSASSDSSVALPSGETEEADDNSSAHHDPIVSQQPPQQSDLIHGQPSPLQPAEQQPQNDGVVTVLSRAWHSVKEACLYME